MGNMIKITDYTEVTPTGSDYLLVNQNGSNKKTTVDELLGDVNSSLSEKANDTDVSRTTTSKTVTGAINEVNASLTEIKKYQCAKAYNSTTQSVTSGANILAFNSEEFDTDNIHDNVTNNSRLTCKTDGKYLIIGTITFPIDNTGTYRGALIKLNNSSYAGQTTSAVVTAGEVTVVSASTIINMSVNDYIELQAYHNASSSLSVAGKLMMVKVG